MFASKFHSILYSLQNIVDLISRLSDRQKAEIQQILASLDRGYLDTFHCMLKILKRDFVTGRMRFCSVLRTEALPGNEDGSKEGKLNHSKPQPPRKGCS